MRKKNNMAGKRTLSVSVKMSEDDYALMERAAKLAWPGAILTKSSTVLSLARLQAERIIQEQHNGKPKK